MKRKLWTLVLSLIMCLLFSVDPSISADTLTPRINVNCSSPFMPGSSSFGPNLKWEPNIQVAYAGSSATVVVYTNGSTSTIRIKRSGGPLNYRFENLFYSKTFENAPYDLGSQNVKFIVTDSRKRSSSFTCTINLKESDFPSALTSSAFITSGVIGGSFSKIKDCRLRGIFLAGNVFISKDLNVDFRVNKTTWQSSADLAVKVTKYASVCGEWNIVTSPSFADFSIYLSSNSLYSDFQIYTGN